MYAIVWYIDSPSGLMASMIHVSYIGTQDLTHKIAIGGELTSVL